MSIDLRAALNEFERHKRDAQAEIQALEQQIATLRTIRAEHDAILERMPTLHDYERKIEELRRQAREFGKS